MMRNEFFDVLPPCEDEVLISWIVRMLRMNSYGKLSTPTSETNMKKFFGPDSTSRPGLYYQKGLSYFAENCALTMCESFSCEANIVNDMTVLPFYFYFLSEKHIESVEQVMPYIQTYRRVENLIGIRENEKLLDKKLYFKYCPKCIRESGEIYLQREHQIQGNSICWKHDCVLQGLPYELNWKSIDFIELINAGKGVPIYILSEEEYKVASFLAETIHEIFEKGFREDIVLLKDKIISRLYELDMLIETNGISFLQDLYERLHISYLYTQDSFNSAMLATLNNKKHPNPIIYLILIRYLFGNLEQYYAYKPNKIKTPDFFSVEKIERIIKKQIIKKQISDMDFYKEFYLKTNIPDDYEILGETKDRVVLKHLVCGNYFTKAKYSACIFRCTRCASSKVSQGSRRQFMKDDIPYTYYLTTFEYGQLHGRTIDRIKVLCNEGRIPGVVYTGKAYLIPIDAPYPKDKRYKESSIQ